MAKDPPSLRSIPNLHNPTAPAFVIKCNACHLDIESGQGWRCDVCPDYDVCSACFNKEAGCVNHPHMLTNYLSLADQNAQNKEARQFRLRKMLEVLVHTSQCCTPHCQYPNCGKVKDLFRDGLQCKLRASGGCFLCKNMWYFLQLHARACKDSSNCYVPRCRDLKEHIEKVATTTGFTTQSCCHGDDETESCGQIKMEKDPLSSRSIPHLHNPTAPAFVITCNACHLDIESGQGWRCEVCPVYDVCNSCFNKEAGCANHPHMLTKYSSLADQNALNKGVRQLRDLELRKRLEVLVHTSQCRSPRCQYPNCGKVKDLFRHGLRCKVRASGGYFLCKNMWYFLQLHARACKDSHCYVPGWRDLKKHIEKVATATAGSTTQSCCHGDNDETESRREVAGTSG